MDNPPNSEALPKLQVPSFLERLAQSPYFAGSQRVEEKRLSDEERKQGRDLRGEVSGRRAVLHASWSRLRLLGVHRQASGLDCRG